MPTIQTEINRVRKNSNIDSQQYSDTNALMDFNKLLRELWVFAKENWDIWTGDIVDGQNEYKANELIDTPNVKITNVDKVYVNYGDKLREAEYVDYYLVDKTSTDFKQDTPIFTFRDSSIFLYPTPDEDVTDGIQIEAKYLLSDYVLTDNVEDIPISRTLLDVVFRFGFEEFIEATVRNNKADAKKLRQDYIEEMDAAKKIVEQVWPESMEVENNRNYNYMY